MSTRHWRDFDTPPAATHCQRCGSHISAAFRRSHSLPGGVVPACPECWDLTRLPETLHADHYD